VQSWGVAGRKKYILRLQSKKLQSKTRARAGGVISVAWSADAVTERQWYPLVRVELEDCGHAVHCGV
jgi:hypothetical protein